MNEQKTRLNVECLEARDVPSALSPVSAARIGPIIDVLPLAPAMVTIATPDHGVVSGAFSSATARPVESVSLNSLHCIPVQILDAAHVVPVLILD